MIIRFGCLLKELGIVEKVETLVTLPKALAANTGADNVDLLVGAKIPLSGFSILLVVLGDVFRHFP